MPNPDCSVLSKTIAEIALDIGSDPRIKDIDGVVAEMQKEHPELDRQMVVSSIVEAHSRGKRERTEMQKKLESLKNEARRTNEPTIRNRLQKQIVELNQKLAGDVSPQPKPEPAPMSKELERMSFERDKLRGEIRQRINDLKPKSIFEKGSEPLNAARAIKTSMDLSAVFRQGGFIAIGNPVRAARNIWPMLRAFASEFQAHKINAEIQARENAPLYARSKLYLSPTEATASLGAREEAFMSKLAGKIPGVKHSERAYTTFLNKLRADSFDAAVKSLARNGEATLVESKAIANYINIATGRGSLAGMDAAAPALNTIFFSPRYFASRLQLLAGQPLYGGTMRTRKLIATEYAKWITGVGVLYALGAAAGGKISTDARDSDAGKIAFGNARVDPLSGAQQIVTFTGRMASGSTVKNGVVTPIRGDKVPYGGDTVAKVIGKFVRSRLSPAAGLVADAVSGEDYSGKPVTAKGMATNFIAPIGASDIYDAMIDQGVEKGTALGLLSIFGMGLQTYGPKSDEAKVKQEKAVTSAAIRGPIRAAQRASAN